MIRFSKLKSKARITKKGFYIGFCGIDGSGKSTQALLLCRWLREQGIDTIVYETKGNFFSEVAETLARKNKLKSARQYLGNSKYLACLSFEILRDNMTKIRPFAEIGTTVVTSRTAFDWLAGAKARGHSISEIMKAEQIMLSAGEPDLVIWLDVSPKVAQKRISQRGYDTANIKFLTRYRRAFAAVLKNHEHHRVQADGNIDEVQGEVKKIVTEFLTKFENS
ncbi:hypothetical protein FJZ40_01545 [Candidatus Shapirobacteria bacterium]|nr:hypothetical protein [Candidatus Shapirobacteria bacterium]